MNFMCGMSSIESMLKFVFVFLMLCLSVQEGGGVWSGLNWSEGGSASQELVTSPFITAFLFPRIVSWAGWCWW